MSLDLHPLCELFPPMEKHAFKRLKHSIGDDGLIDPIVTLGGRILDGRHRYKACEELGIEPETVEYDGDDPRGFVLARNMERRHLNSSQRAMVAAKLANMANGGIREGQNTRAAQTANLQSEVSRARAADTLDVSERSVNAAKKLQREAPPNVVRAVESGQVALHTAEKVVKAVRPDKVEVMTAADIKAAHAALADLPETHLANALTHATALAEALRNLERIGASVDIFLVERQFRDAAYSLERLR